MSKSLSKGFSMSDELKLAAGLVVAFISTVFVWVGRLIWVNHTDLQKLRIESPTWSEMNREIQKVSDSKDKMIKDQHEDLTYIRKRLDTLVDKLNKE